VKLVNEGKEFGSEGFWRWFVTLRNTRFLDFVHRPEF
jgi:hypothetical protein